MAKIFVYDEFNPQDTAMMQALYSRSPLSVEEHVKKVKETGSGKFMEKFYVGYGHASIADCGSTTIFIEQVSILADKAIQDWPLYSGQETSTRYVDMSKQPIIDPIGTVESKKILDNWMNFYIGSQERLKGYLRKKYPRKPEEDKAIYEKAIAARCFDIMRGFLPAGITTQLSWHSNLRQAWDKLAILRHNPIPEIREIADSIHKKLREKYPQSFSHKLYEDQENYRKFINDSYYYNPPKYQSDFSINTTIPDGALEEYKDLLEKRPQKTNLPIFLYELGTITFDFYLDYGSFRDIHRHRNGICRMPLLTTEIGFNSWYLEQLPDDLRSEAEKLIEKQKEAISKLDAEPVIKQYYVALGFNAPLRVTYGLPATVYVVELRSGKMVHPTLRRIAHKMREALLQKFPDLVLHCDMDPDDWDVRRGLQDITEK
jgi:thymidylate synthase ThyX